MAHPLCGKCHSASVYQDFDANGQPVIACFMCGNRYPGGQEGFYMSGSKDHLKAEGKDETATIPPAGSAAIPSSPRKLCVTCGEKPTISDSSPYCPSCMNKRGRESRKGKTAPVGVGRKRTTEDKHAVEKTPTIENMAVNIDFGKHPLVFKEVQDLAEQEIRPIELQIIYLLKRHFETDKAFLKEV